MTTKEERLQFLEAMGDVEPIRKPDRADLEGDRQLTPGQLERQRAAVLEKTADRNPLTATDVVWLGPQDELSYKRDGIQHGVFRKLRLGQYPIAAQLDLHRMTMDEARQEVFNFIRECLRHGARSVLIKHGKGERNPDRIAVIKSCINQWLPQLADVMAFHSAQPKHGGTGAVYVMLRKSPEERERNREQFGGP